MGDLMALAFRLDLTRVCTFMWANEGSNRTFPEIDVREGHHHLSHHAGDTAKIDAIRRINRWQNERFADLVSTFAETDRTGSFASTTRCSARRRSRREPAQPPRSSDHRRQGRRRGIRKVVRHASRTPVQSLRVDGSGGRGAAGDLRRLDGRREALTPRLRIQSFGRIRIAWRQRAASAT